MRPRRTVTSYASFSKVSGPFTFWPPRMVPFDPTQVPLSNMDQELSRKYSY